MAHIGKIAKTILGLGAVALALPTAQTFAEEHGTKQVKFTGSIDDPVRDGTLKVVGFGHWMRDWKRVGQRDEDIWGSAKVSIDRRPSGVDQTGTITVSVSVPESEPPVKLQGSLEGPLNFSADPIQGHTTTQDGMNVTTVEVPCLPGARMQGELTVWQIKKSEPLITSGITACEPVTDDFKVAVRQLVIDGGGASRGL